MSWLKKLGIDGFTTALLGMVLLASLLPVHGAGTKAMDIVTDLAIAALFFLHGARLSREAILSGLTAWRLHLLIFAGTFVLFPLLGVAGKPLAHWLLTPGLALGMLYLCALPSTVQSSIAFTSMAGGNVPAAVTSASASSLFGVFLTPFLMGLLAGSLLGKDGGAMGNPLHAVLSIVLQLLLPFVAGHLLRPWIGDWVLRKRALLRLTDQGTILLVVYTAFSAAVVEGLWRDTPLRSLLALCALSCLLLALVMGTLTFAARRFGFVRADEIAIVFCGSKKSLATGVPMAKILFASANLGAIVLPLMIFHQIQLIVCAVVARNYAKRNAMPQAVSQA